MDLTFVWHRWASLRPDMLYAFLKLRSDIFVVEQNCVFPEMDGIDPLCEHLTATTPDGELAAYLRLIPAGVKRPHSESPAAVGPAIGRVAVAPEWRGIGLGRNIMVQAVHHCLSSYPEQPVSLSGQQHLESFYGSLGFVTQSESYLEDGIWHVDMQRPAILAMK